MSSSQIEQQLTILLRRVQSIHLSTSDGKLDLERSAYGILCRLADDGPQRLGSLATAFGLDPSTITRQVQSLEGANLVGRVPDPKDRRASVLSLSDEGLDALNRTREYRRERMRTALAGWEGGELDEFGRLLAKFNDAMEKMLSAADD